MAADASAPRLGVYGEPVAGGVRITQVVADSAADRAGLSVGDIIRTVDGHVVTDMPSLTAIVRARQVGDKATVEFIRQNTEHRIEVSTD